MPRGHRLNLWGSWRVNICSWLSKHPIWLVQSCWGLHEWEGKHAVRSLHWSSGPCTTEAFSFFRASREAGQGGHSFSCLAPMENRDSPKVVSGCRCTTVTFAQTPGLLHTPLQGTPLPPLGWLNRGEGLSGFDCYFAYYVPASRFLAHSWEPVHCTMTCSALLRFGQTSGKYSPVKLHQSLIPVTVNIPAGNHGWQGSWLLVHTQM